MLNLPLYFGVLWNMFFLPYAGLVSGISYIVAYYLACGRFVVPAAIYGAGVVTLFLWSAGLLLQYHVVEPYFVVAFIASLAYASVFGSNRGGRILSPLLMLVAIIVGGFYAIFAAALWRTVVPSLGLAPWLPEPQDFPLYVVLYSLWRRIHTVVKSVRCAEGEPASRPTSRPPPTP